MAVGTFDVGHAASRRTNGGMCMSRLNRRCVRMPKVGVGKEEQKEKEKVEVEERRGQRNGNSREGRGERGREGR